MVYLATWMVDFYYGKWIIYSGSGNTLDIQILCEDRCLDPQTSPEVRLLGVPNTDPHQVFGGFWMSRDRWWGII